MNPAGTPLRDFLTGAKHDTGQTSHGRRDEFIHQVEQRLVIRKVARRHQAHAMQVRRENVRIFIDGSVLYH